MAGALVALVMLDTFLTGYLLVKVTAVQRLTVHSVARDDELTELLDLLPCRLYEDDMRVEVIEEECTHE